MFDSSRSNAVNEDVQMNVKTAIKIAGLVLGFAVPALAQFRPSEMMHPYAFTNQQGRVLMCQMAAPQFVTPGKRYPVILFFHGSGECGTDNQLQLKCGISCLLNQLVKQPEPVFVVAPQCIQGNWWVRSLAFSADYHMPEISASLDDALAICQHVIDTAGGDPDRFYITGLSLGGFGTWDALQRFPDRFAAAVPICGGGDVHLAKKMAQVPVWVFHGQDDKNVHPDCSRRMVDALRHAGARDARYTEYPHVAHDCWDAAYSTPQLVPWMLEQHRTKNKRSWWKFW